jgi:nucleoside-diphosphate kinase
MADRTFVIVKPDAVERSLVGEITSRFERKGLRIVALEMRVIDADVASRHYAEHQGKPFYDDLVAFIGRSPAVTMVLEGPQDTWRVVRSMMGATNPLDSPPGTIRGDYGLLLTENLVHGSDGPESAVREIGIFFPHLA